MANMEHLQLVKQGRDAVARWREANPNLVMDLNASYLSHARIPQVNLMGADLRNSDLMGTMLRRANLAACYLNPCHMYRADLREANLSRALANGANLRGADLRDANLEYGDFDRAIFSEADLTGANLTGANLSRANLTGANLTGANLSNTNLNGARLIRSNLTDAILDGADLFEATFTSATLKGTKFGGCVAGYTAFQDCDLSQSLGLDLVQHDAPSTLGVDSLLRSGGQIPDAFLLGSGATAALLAFQKTLATDGANLSTYFISCAESDLPFARKLLGDLQARGLRCWLYPENARGKALVERHSVSDQEEVERWVRHYDKLVVVCSKAGLECEPVRKDMTEVLDKQRASNAWLGFLVSPDDTVTSRARNARQLRWDHTMFDLRGWNQPGDETYQKELDRLVEGLTKNLPAAADVGDPNA